MEKVKELIEAFNESEYKIDLIEEKIQDLKIIQNDYIKSRNSALGKISRNKELHKDLVFSMFNENPILMCSYILAVKGTLEGICEVKLYSVFGDRIHMFLNAEKYLKTYSIHNKETGEKVFEFDPIDLEPELKKIQSRDDNFSYIIEGFDKVKLIEYVSYAEGYKCEIGNSFIKPKQILKAFETYFEMVEE